MYDRHGIVRTTITALALALVVAAPLTRVAAQQSVPASTQALLLLRSLGYDRALRSRALNGRVVVGVLHKPGSPASGDCERDVSGALRSAMQGMTVDGLPVSVSTIGYPRSGDVAGDLKRVQALYVCTGLEAEVEAISAASRGTSTLTFTGSEGYVRGGLAIGFVQREGRSAMLINVPAAQAEGAQLESALLRVAELIR